MDEQKKRFDSIDITTLDDFGISDVQTIEEGALQNYLINDPLPEKPEKVKQVVAESPEEKADTPKKNETPTGPTEEDFLKKFLSDEETDEDQPSAASESKKNQLKTPAASPQASAPLEEDNIYATLNEDLIKAGIFTESEDPIADSKTFKEKFIQEMNRGANVIVDQFLGQHGQEYREAFDAIFVQGVAPATYYALREQIDDFENLDITREENQEKVLRTFYQSKGFSSEKINAKITKIKDYGDLEEDAQQVHEVLLKEQKQKLEEQKEIAQQEAYRREQNRLNYRTAVQEILQEKMKAKSFEGIPLTTDLAQKIYTNLTQDAFKLPNNRVITAFEKDIMELDMPQNFEKKVKLALLMENGFDFSVIKRAAIKEETNDLFEGLERKKKKKQLPTASEQPKYF
jgi:hypothetical protein